MKEENENPGGLTRREFLYWSGVGMAGMTERAAYFVCCLVLVHGENRFLVAQETVDGVIADAPRGRNGFGYDPLFFFPARGQTMAELSDAEKDLVSHRGRAARRMIALLRADD